MQPAAPDFAGTARFKLIRMLGEGGMGIVYEAQDRERGGARVALKTLRTFSAESLLRFKQEFRTLQALHHPNLVGLGELIEEGGQWFFTMELVDGVNFVRYVRASDDCDEVSDDGETPIARRPMPAPVSDSSPTAETGSATMEQLIEASHTGSSAELDLIKLRVALAQLAEGVAALHHAGKVHRDVKPSNILVTGEGRVVLLDFGLVAELEDNANEQRVVGTVDYMAPEQALGGKPGPHADWYSVGAVLYEAITGRPPFIGPSMQVLMDKQKFDPVAPHLIAPSVPKSIETLCLELLRRDPLRRPSDREILLRLGVQNARPAVAAPATLFVGRKRELKELLAASETPRAVEIVVRGESGVGKSGLVRAFLDELAAHAPGVVTLAGRCQERETVPFKAFDGVVDALSRFLARTSRDELSALLPSDTAALAHLFPVLSRVDAVAALPQLEKIPAPPVLRGRAYAALRELLTNVARRRRVVVVIDDFQWADAESLSLRKEVFGPAGPAALLLLTVRSDAFLRPELFDAGARRIELERLDPDAARALSSALLAQNGITDEATAAQIADGAGGHPLFIEQLVRDTVESGVRGGGLDQAIWARIRRLDEPLRRVVELVAVAPAPIAQEVASASAELEFSAFAKLSTVLRAANLVRTSGARRNDTIEPYHDLVRSAVLTHLQPSEVAGYRRRLKLATATAEP